jgi:hypothetical protein
MANWHGNLARPLTLRDGAVLSTLADARAFILALPDHVQRHQAWQYAAKLLVAAAEDDDFLETATNQVELALFLDARNIPGA